MEVADHAQASGLVVGSAVEEGVPWLGRAVAETVSDQVEGTTSPIQREAALLASLTSGVLMGIADFLHGPHHADESQELREHS